MVSLPGAGYVHHAFAKPGVDLVHGFHQCAEVAEILQSQDAHHDRSGVRWAPAPAGVTPGQQVINDLGEVVKVDVPGNEL